MNDHHRIHPALAAGLVLAAASPIAGAQDADRGTDPAQGSIYAGMKSRWAEQVPADHPLPEYPRPQMRRDDWVNLNGPWQYAIVPRDAGRPETWDGTIRVPFAAESQLSGVQRPVGEANRLWYRRTFEVPRVPDGGRLLLHFGAVDWRAEVWVNGVALGSHEGGYDPFTFDVTDALTEGGGQELVVAVWDPTDAASQPRGKQVEEPRGIWYTAVTGIWQTVWLEPVPAVSIDALRIVPDVDAGTVAVGASVRGASGSGWKLEVEVAEGAGATVGSGPAERTVSVDVAGAKLWSPREPVLHEVEVRLLDGAGTVVDAVDAYFAMRKIHFAPDEYGFNRLFLNNEPLFQYGPLDQGWWPDGLYTAPTDEALRFDVEVTRKLGFNMARKHVKVEPARWYYWADRLGLLVWQDMPSGFRRGSGQNIGADSREDAAFTPGEKAVFRRELGAMMDALGNHPCIVAWVPFNEGWGQHDTNEVLRWTKERDPSRLVGGPSGWADRGFGDLHDMHRYPGPGMFPTTDDRVSVLGEFGGLGLALDGHLWWNKRNWGYRSFENRDELRRNYDVLIEKMLPLIGSGLAAAVYTQTTDVEGEVNGLMTYDRQVVKFDPDHLAGLHATLYEPHKPVVVRAVVPTSEQEGQSWRFTTSDPGEGWEQAGFDDSAWNQGKGGFGTPDTPGAVVGTRWDTSDLWLRRTFEWKPGDYRDLHLRLHHDEDVVVHLNGTEILRLTGWTDGYIEVPVPEAARRVIREGANTVAVQVRQTSGGQFIDIGVVDRVPVDSPDEFRRLQR